MASSGAELRRRGKWGAAGEIGGGDAPEAQKPCSPSIPDLQPGTFWLTRLVLLRSTAFIYCVAFLVAYHQNKALIGDRGLLPCKLYLEDVKRYAKGKVNLDALSYAPTVFWFLDWSNMDAALDGVALGGLALSAFVLITACANMVLMATLWTLYLSLVNVGQIWMGIPASGNRLFGNIPLPFMDTFPLAEKHASFPHHHLGLSVADFQDHAWSGLDQNPRRPLLESSDLHELPLRDPTCAQPHRLLHAPLSGGFPPV
uniref:Lipase maturation factor 1 n=1 Tax=Anolis carolinensis TaxID=28377 RepID=H9GAZ9_ANOCA